MTDTQKLVAPTGLEHFYATHRHGIYGFFLSRLGNHHDAEDLTQRVFLDAIIALERTDTPPDSVLALLYTVAQRRLVDELRRRRQTTRLLERLRPSQARYHYDDSTSSRLRESLEAIQGTPQKVVVLRLVHGLRFSEIATLLGTTEAASKMMFSRAVADLRDTLAHC